MYVDRPAVDEPDRARHSIPRPQSDKLLEQTFAGKPTHMLARAGNGYRRSRPAEDLRKLPNPSLSFRKGLQFPSFPPSISFRKLLFLWRHYTSHSNLSREALSSGGSE